MKLRTKILLLLLIISLIPMLSISYLLTQKNYEDVKEKTEIGLLNLVESKAEYYDEELKTIRLDLETTANFIEWNWGKGKYYNLSYIWISPNGTGYEKFVEDMKNFEYVMQAFEVAIQENDKINLAFLGLENGVNFISNPKLVEKLQKEIKYFDHRERIWYKLAKEKNGTVWSPLYIDVNTGELVTTVSTPIHINKKFIGVLGFDILLETIKHDILDIKFAGAGYPLLVDNKGFIFVHPEYTAGGKKWNESFKEKNIFNLTGLCKIGNEIINGSTGFEIIKLPEGKCYAVYSPINEINGSLVFILPEKVVLQSIGEMKEKMLFAALIIAVAIIIISIIFSTHIVRPLEKLQRATREIAKGNLSYRVNVEGKDEVADLAKDFNKMADELAISRRALKESEEKYRGIFEKSTDVIYISTEDGRLIDINEAGEKLFGYTKEELLNMNVGNLYADKNDRIRFQEAIKGKGYVKDYEVKLKRKDGKVIDCLLSSTMIKKGDKIYYQGIIRDITPMKEAKKQVEMYNSLLRHDISNRNQISIGCLELLKETNLNEEQKKLVEKAYEHLLQSQQLLQKLSIINKVERVERKKVDVDEMLFRSIEKYEEMAKEKGIKINYEKKAKDTCVIADDLLENVFSNIIENAIVHSGCNNINIKLDERNDEMVIEIKDDGRGIPKEIRDKIFEWGIKGKESKGSGLGLHLVKRIIESYGGKITLKEAEKGATFEIRLQKC